MDFKGTKGEVTGLTDRVWAWGDGYWEKGWITEVYFERALDVYTKARRK